MHESANRNDDHVRIGGICGSLRDGSYTRLAVQLALEGARETGAEIELIDLRSYELIFCAGDENGEEPADVERLRATVRSCNGLILGTPEYHGSFSGVLKNALDLMGFDEMSGKMIGLVGVSGGAMGGLNALNGLRTVGRALHAWVVPEQATIPKARQLFDAEGHLADGVLEQRLREVGRQVARFAFLHGSEQAQEFLRLWEGAPPNPGA